MGIGIPPEILKISPRRNLYTELHETLLTYIPVLIVASECVPQFTNCSKCGIRDPSWVEIHHFIKFMSFQLNACELSAFCDETLVGDVLSGLKRFVTKFTLRMAQVI